MTAQEMRNDVIDDTERGKRNQLVVGYVQQQNRQCQVLAVEGQRRTLALLTILRIFTNNCFNSLLTDYITMSNHQGNNSSHHNDDDEFGDGSFLMDFDVDAAIDQQQQQRQQHKHNQKQEHHALNKEPLSSNNKRRKVLSTAADHSNVKKNSKNGVENTVIIIDDDDDDNGIDNGVTEQHNAIVINNTKNKNSTGSCDNDGSYSSLEDTLSTYFGYTKFRSQQREAIENIFKGNDVVIFWATGNGKSICYQLPSLHKKKPSIIVSPLISLMQDQVTKLNNTTMIPTDNGNTTRRKIATYLGSGQLDSMEETRALNGEYLLIYVTPEKLLSNGFLDKLARSLDLCLIAIDESHCVR